MLLVDALNIPPYYEATISSDAYVGYGVGVLLSFDML